jgi:hypothetical protein
MAETLFDLIQEEQQLRHFNSHLMYAYGMHCAGFKTEKAEEVFLSSRMSRMALGPT